MRVDPDFPLAREGLPFIAAGLAVAAIGGGFGLAWCMALGLGWAAACAFFFRNPRRLAPSEPGLVVAPADGKVIAIAECPEPTFLRRPMRRVSIFLSVLDVHVNRAPIAGTVMGTHYTPGKFCLAYRPEASACNERNAVWLRSVEGHDCVYVQVAGAVARRIVSYAETGKVFARGERVGIIRFGSRTDCYLPLTWPVEVAMGAMVRGGKTILARVH
ncbi:MAG: phosphatidylserine decarboxylase family protein [Deltaproteobacteria bacterium]|nr:phosphatidylserine decarboxylase family protein [Deltaproteobacteria bacterium]